MHYLLRIFFPKMKAGLSLENSMEQNRYNIIYYIEDNIYLWMLWSVIGMAYNTFSCSFIVLNSYPNLSVIATLLHYIFLFIVLLAIGILKIMKLSPEEAQHIAKTINPFQD